MLIGYNVFSSTATAQYLYSHYTFLLSLCYMSAVAVWIVSSVQSSILGSPRKMFSALCDISETCCQMMRICSLLFIGDRPPNCLVQVYFENLFFVLTVCHVFLNTLLHFHDCLNPNSFWKSWRLSIKHVNNIACIIKSSIHIILCVDL